MELKLQKRLAAQIMKCSPKRVWLDPSRLSDIKETITKADIKSMIAEGAIVGRPARGISRVRARKIRIQKRKGRQRGFGSRKGARTARLPKKRAWINRIRTQRELLSEMRDNGKLTKNIYQQLYMKSKGGFFRSRRHILLYIEEHKMKQSKTYAVPFRRKRRGETDYRKRLRFLLSGKLRLVVRKSLSNMVAQVVEYDEKGDKVILTVNTTILDKYGWNINKGNLPSAYLLGLLLGNKAKKQGINDLVLDMCLNKSVKGSRVYAVLKGVIDAGINVPHSKEILPSEERVKGMHIAKYAEHLKKEGTVEKVFSDYLKNKVDPSKIVEHFEITKKKIAEAD
jgi:large subunit ribosomal protein L18